MENKPNNETVISFFDQDYELLFNLPAKELTAQYSGYSSSQ